MRRYTGITYVLIGCASLSAGTMQVTDLGLLPGATFSNAIGVNEQGEVVGWSGPGGSPQPFMWSDQTGMQPVPVAGLGQANAINGAGAIVGTADSRAFRWTPGGGSLDLGTLPGHTASTAYAVNTYGVAVGWSMNPNPPDRIRRAVMWDTLGTIAELADAPGFNWTEASDINGSGIIVGHGSDADSGALSSSALIWPTHETVIEIGVPAGWGSSTATSINDSGQVVVGTRSTDGTSGAVFLWQQSFGFLGLGWLPNARSIRPGSINNDGIVVGEYVDLGGLIRPYIWDADAGIRDLNDEFGLTEGGSVFIVGAHGINDSGQIVGSAYFDGSTAYRGVLITIPAPGGTAVALAGCIVGARRRRTGRN